MAAVAQSFESWYEREHPRLLGLLCAATGNVERAAEATDEAFARALARWERVSRMESPSGWTYRVALNVVRKQMRQRERERRHPGTKEPERCVPASQPEVWEAVRALPARQAEAVLLRYVADLPEAEIASVMRVKRGTVASLLSAARGRLAVLLAEELEEMQ